MKTHQLITAAVLVLFASNAVEARKEKADICHVGNEAGPSGEVYLDDPGCVPIEDNGYFCPDAGKIDLISVANANKHLNNPSHEWDEISDYLPSDVGASGEGNTDTDGDGIDEGCEPNFLVAFLAGPGDMRADFGGLSAADAICQLQADNAGLTGTYIAWMSDSSTDAKDRFDPAFAEIPYIRAGDGALVANRFGDLYDEDGDGTFLINAVNRKADGTFVGNSGGWGFAWTGTLRDGTRAADNCNDWTDDTVEYNGVSGSPQWSFDRRFTEHNTYACNTVDHGSKGVFYCFQKDRGE